jgi:hypothetical protein
VLELLHVRFLIKYPVSLALPKSHPHADKPEIPLALLKEEPFIGLNRMYPNYGDWLGFQAANRQGSGRRRERACFCRSGVWRGGGQRTAAEDTRQGRDFSRSDSRGQRVGACGGRLEAGRSIRSGRYSVRQHSGSKLCQRKRAESASWERSFELIGGAFRNDVHEPLMFPRQCVVQNVENIRGIR